MERDAVIGIAGGVVLVAALVVVLVAESGSAPETQLTYPVQWLEAEAGTTREEQQLAEGEQAQLQFGLPARNVTTVELLLQWTDDSGNPDTFNLSVEGPGGEPVAVASSDTGEIVLRFELNPLPAATNVRATDQTAAARQLVQDHASDDGRGTWTATVTLASAPGQRPVPQVPDLEVQPDGSNNFTLQFSYDVYRAQVGEPLPPP